MTEPNPFAQYQQPAPTATNGTTPPPVTVAPTQNPATVSPSAADAAAQYAAFQQYQAQQAAIAAAQAAPVAPPVPAAPPIDPGYAAWLAQQQQAQAAPATVAAPAVPPANFQPPAYPPAGGAPSGGSDPFDDPAPPRPKGPRLEDMYGRLLLIIPKEMGKGSSTEDDGRGGKVTKTYDRLTADVIVLDGGPMPYGGKPNGRPPVPHDREATIPHREVAMFISAGAIISACRDAYDKRQRGEPGMVLGRLAVGEQPADPRHTRPWILTSGNDADRARARAYLATIDPFA